MFRLRVQELQAWGLDFRFWGSGLSGLGCQGLAFRIQGLGFWDEVLGIKV